MYKTSLFALALALVARAAPAPPHVGICAVCPGQVNSTTTSIAQDGTDTKSTTTYWLVNHSNSGAGTPTYCGFNQDETHYWYQVFCFYSPNGKFYSSSDGFIDCPASTTTGTC